jgi:hypothetical protein
VHKEDARYLFLSCDRILPIPGQEAANSDFLLERGAATKVNRVEDFSFRVEKLLGSKKLMEMKNAARALERPQAAADICREVARRLEQLPKEISKIKAQHRSLNSTAVGKGRSLSWAKMAPRTGHEVRDPCSTFGVRLRAQPRRPMVLRERRVHRRKQRWPCLGGLCRVDCHRG